MHPAGPVIVIFTAHGQRRAFERGLSVKDVAEIVLAQHHRRQRNPGEADWLVRDRGIAISYNWPDAGDATTALVVSCWRE
jgi:hypothetical protein